MDPSDINFVALWRNRRTERTVRDEPVPFMIKRVQERNDFAQFDFAQFRFQNTSYCNSGEPSE